MLCGFLVGTETLTRGLPLIHALGRADGGRHLQLELGGGFFFLSHYFVYTLSAFKILSLNYRPAVSTTRSPRSPLPHPVPSTEKLLFLKRYKGQ